jgi:hypothetical protein
MNVKLNKNGFINVKESLQAWPGYIYIFFFCQKLSKLCTSTGLGVRIPFPIFYFFYWGALSGALKRTVASDGLWLNQTYQGKKERIFCFFHVPFFTMICTILILLCHAGIQKTQAVMIMIRDT